MKLILTEYIASLKEDKELDSLIQDILRENNFEIVFRPERGRQYGVDIYAVGKDMADGIKKLFLITVKQGNLDRNVWHGSGKQSIEPSLYELVTVFVRNNILPEHSKLPIKIVVAYNGYTHPAIQQNIVAFCEQFPKFEFENWQLEKIVNLVFDKLISENIFTDKARTLLRKIIINLYNPDYDLSDYWLLLGTILDEEKDKIPKKHATKRLKKVNLVFSIAISFCEQENDTRLATRIAEITELKVWEYLTRKKKTKDQDFLTEFVQTKKLRIDTIIKYLTKIIEICSIKDGFSVYCRDNSTYTFVVYQHLGYIALAGLEFLFCNEQAEGENEAREFYFDLANTCANAIIELLNNNPTGFNPKFDDNIIEIQLVFILLYKIGRQDVIKDLLKEFNERLAWAKLFHNTMPYFSNNAEEVLELENDSEKRSNYTHDTSSLLTALIEWTIVLNDEQLYDSYKLLYNRVFEGVDLILWLPDSDTEEVMFSKRALPETGYCLSNIELTNFADFYNTTKVDYKKNKHETKFAFLKQGFWTTGLVASRHHKTYVFPHYWRQFIK